MNLHKIVYQKINSYVNTTSSSLSDGKILIAISAGVDSVVLSHLLHDLSKKYNFTIGLAHVNYNMQSNSMIAMEKCKTLANQFDCSIYVKDVSFKILTNVEATAREIRYSFLQSIASNSKYNYILTAHHEDDQVETIFMKNMQNADWISKIGIRENLGNIIRPLLHVNKKTILKYAKENNLTWIEDVSNRDECFLRNKIRNSLLPEKLKEYPNYKTELLNQVKSSLNKLNQLHERLDSNYYKLVSQIGQQLDWFSITLKSIAHFTRIEKKFLCQILLNKYFSMPNVQKTSQCWHEFNKFTQQSSIGSIFVINKNVSVLKDRVDLIFFKTPVVKSNILKIDKVANYTWNDSIFHISNRQKNKKSTYVLHVSDKVIRNGLKVRVWKDSDKIYSYRNRKIVKVSKLFTNEKISTFHKNKYPIVTDNDDNIMWIPGIDHAIYKSTDNNNIEIRCTLFNNEWKN
jgi:tRNA(Ile)-lysidine synthase